MENSYTVGALFLRQAYTPRGNVKGMYEAYQGNGTCHEVHVSFQG